MSKICDYCGEWDVVCMGDHTEETTVFVWRCDCSAVLHKSLSTCADLDAHCPHCGSYWKKTIRVAEENVLFSLSYARQVQKREYMNNGN